MKHFRTTTGKKILAATLFSLGLLFAFTTAADAATLYWVGTDGANASVASNWKLTNPTTCGGGDSPAAPTSADTITFDTDCDSSAIIDTDFAGTVAGVGMGLGYSGTVTQARPLIVTAGFAQSGGSWNAGNNDLTIGGAFTLNSPGGAFTASSGVTSFAGTFTITTGSFVHNSGTVNFSGANTALNCNSTAFNRVTFVGQTGTKTVGAISSCTFPLGNNPTIPTSITLNNATLQGTGTLTFSAGSLTLNSINSHIQDFTSMAATSIALSVSADVSLDLSTYTSFVSTGTITVNLGTLKLSNTANTLNALTINGGTTTHSAGTLTLGAVRVQGGTLTLANGADLNSGLIISSGTFNAPSGSMSLASSLTVTNYPSQVTFNNNGGTIVFDGTSGTMACGNLPFSKIIIANTGSTKTIGADCTLPLGANPTVGAGGGVTSNGVLDGTGTLSMSAGLLTINAGATLTNFTGLAINNLTLNGVVLNLSTYNLFTVATTVTLATSTLSLPSGSVIGGSLSVTTGGIFNAPAGTVSIGRHFLTEGGTFNHNNGTIILNSTSSAQTISGSNTFYNLTKIAAGSNASLTGTAGTTQTILNNLVLKGAPNTLLPIDSTISGSQWNIDAQGVRDMEHLFVRDSNNINATTMQAGTGSLDNGNNTNWSFPVNTRYMVSTGVTYTSTLDTLDLKMDIGYDSTLTNAPVLLILHGHSSIFSGTDIVQRLAKKGIFAIQTYKRGYNGSQGISDDSGREIQDFVDAAEYVKANYGAYVDENNINVVGYSGGGGNAYGLVTKFPDYFNSAQIFFGISDYGHDPEDSWWYDGASTSQKNIMSTRIGGTPTDVPDNYYSRALYLGAKNNPDTHIQLFYDTAEAVVPPVNATQYTTVASGAGLTNITTRISDSNSVINEVNEIFTNSNNGWVFLGGGASSFVVTGGALNWTTTRGPVFDVASIPVKSLRNYGPTSHVKSSFDMTITSATLGASAAISLRNSNNILLQNTLSMLLQNNAGLINLYLRADYNDTAFSSDNRTLQMFTTVLSVGTAYKMDIELNNNVLTGVLRNADGTVIETQSFTLDGTKTFTGIDSFGISNFVASAGTETMSGTIDNVLVDGWARYIHGAPQEGEEGREGNISAENYFVPGIVAGTYAQPVLATTDDMFIPGFIKTKEFEVFLGNGNDEAGELEYDISGNTKTFTIESLTGPANLSLKVKNLSANAKYIVAQADSSTEMTTDSSGSLLITGSISSTIMYEITPVEVKTPSRVVGGSYRAPITTTPVVPVTPITPTDTTCKPGDIFSSVTGARCSVSTTTPTIPSVPGTTPTFTRSLSLGMSGEDVKALQIYLNQKGFVVSTTGAGSIGKETTYFGPATKAAVIKFQLANKIIPAVGFFGPLTRSYIK